MKILAKDDKNVTSSVAATVVDKKNGTFLVSYVPTVSGTHTINVNVISKGILSFLCFVLQIYDY